MNLFAPPPPQPSRRRVAIEEDCQLAEMRDDPSVAEVTTDAPDRLQTPPTSQVPEPVDSILLSSTAPSSSVQLNLFGTPVPILKSRASTSTTHFDVCKENVIVGDSNLGDFDHSSCTVFSHANGRLSHFQALLAASKKIHQHVLKFFICLSTLDARNNFSSNSTALKSVLGAARRVFPQAQIFVMLLGYDSSLPSEMRDNIQALNNFVICKHPSSCLHVTAPKEFSISNHSWSAATRQSVYAKISDCLNYE